MKYNTVVVKDAHSDQKKGRAEYLNLTLENFESVKIIEEQENIKLSGFKFINFLSH